MTYDKESTRTGRGLVGPRCLSWGHGEPGAEGKLICSMPSFLAPPLRTWKPGFFLPCPSTRRKDSRESIIPSHLRTPLTFRGVPTSRGSPTAPSGGGAGIHTSLAVRPPVCSTWPWTAHVSKNRIMAVENKNHHQKTQLAFSDSSLLMLTHVRILNFLPWAGYFWSFLQNVTSEYAAFL